MKSDGVRRSHLQKRILLFLNRTEAGSVAALARNLDVHGPSANRAILTLEKAGLVTRVGRAPKLTRNGRAEVKRLEKAMEADRESFSDSIVRTIDRRSLLEMTNSRAIREGMRAAQEMMNSHGMRESIRAAGQVVNSPAMSATMRAHQQMMNSPTVREGIRAHEQMANSPLTRQALKAMQAMKGSARLEQDLKAARLMMDSPVVKQQLEAANRLANSPEFRRQTQVVDRAMRSRPFLSDMSVAREVMSSAIFRSATLGTETLNALVTRALTGAALGSLSGVKWPAAEIDLRKFAEWVKRKAVREALQTAGFVPSPHMDVELRRKLLRLHARGAGAAELETLVVAHCDSDDCAPIAAIVERLANNPEFAGRDETLQQALSAHKANLNSISAYPLVAMIEGILMPLLEELWPFWERDEEADKARPKVKRPHPGHLDMPPMLRETADAVRYLEAIEGAVVLSHYMSSHFLKPFDPNSKSQSEFVDGHIYRHALLHGWAPQGTRASTIRCFFILDLLGELVPYLRREFAELYPDKFDGERPRADG